MINLSNKEINDLITLLSISLEFDLDPIIIDSLGVRGTNKDRSCFILGKDCPIKSKYPVAFTRLNTFISRINLMKNLDNFELKYSVNEDKGEINQFTILAKKTKMEFRCMSMIVAESKKPPKGIKDPNLWKIKIQPKEIELIVNAIKTLNSKQIKIKTNGYELIIECRDSVNDKFTMTVNENVEFNDFLHLEEENDGFSLDFDVSLLLPLFKLNTDSIFLVSENGILTSCINNYLISIFSKLEE